MEVQKLRALISEGTKIFVNFAKGGKYSLLAVVLPILFVKVFFGQDEENIIVPIHAYPVMSGADELPESVTLPITPLGETSNYKIPLTCTAPIDFQFQIRTPTPHIAFTVVPMEGLLNVTLELYLQPASGF